MLGVGCLIGLLWCLRGISGFIKGFRIVPLRMSTIPLEILQKGPPHQD